jgi:hypothetical protein
MPVCVCVAAGAVALPEDQPQGYDIELQDVHFSYRTDQPILRVSDDFVADCNWCRLESS